MSHYFSSLAQRVAAIAGSWQAFTSAVIVVVTWVLGGFYYGFGSDIYQLLINTFTTIITFLMVFLIQGATNRSERAVQIKLDEIIRALDKADDRLIDLEEGTEADMAEAKARVSSGKGSHRPQR